MTACRSRSITSSRSRFILSTSAFLKTYRGTNIATATVVLQVRDVSPTAKSTGYGHWPHLAFRRRDHAVSHGPQWRADQRQQHRRQHVVPACASHFPVTGHHIRQQELQRHPGDMRHRRRHTQLQSLNSNVREAKLLQPCREQVKLAKLLDHPALAQLAVNALLQCAGKPVAPEKAVGNDEASTGPQQAVRLRQQCALVRAVRMTTALERVCPVIAAAWQNRVFVVALDDAHTLTAAGCVVERMCVLHLPRYARESQ